MFSFIPMKSIKISVGGTLSVFNWKFLRQGTIFLFSLILICLFFKLALQDLNQNEFG